MEILLHSLLHPSFLDVIIAILSFLVGRITGGLGTFLVASLILTRITRWYFSSHPQAAAKLARGYEELAVLYKKEFPKKDPKFVGYTNLNKEVALHG